MSVYTVNHKDGVLKCIAFEQICAFDLNFCLRMHLYSRWH